MNELQTFNFKENEVRTLLIDNEPYFIGKDVATVLGYERADNAIRSHVDDEDKLMHQISASGQRRNMTLINESGLYSLILSSKLPQAKEFKRWVTKEVLPSIRKTGGYKVPSSPMEALRLMFDAQKQQEEKIDQVDKRVTNLENTTTIVSSQQLTLTKIAKATAIKVLGGKDSIAYKNLSHEVFRKMWRDYKDYFKLASYKDTLKTDYEKAINYLKEWRPDTNLAYEIQAYNIEY